MKNKKLFIIIALIIVVLAIILGALKFRGLFLFNEDGTIADGHAELIERLKSVEDKDERKRQIDFSLQSNIITQEEANDLY